MKRLSLIVLAGLMLAGCGDEDSAAGAQAGVAPSDVLTPESYIPQSAQAQLESAAPVAKECALHRALSVARIQECDAGGGWAGALPWGTVEDAITSCMSMEAERLGTLEQWLVHSECLAHRAAASCAELEGPLDCALVPAW